MLAFFAVRRLGEGEVLEVVGAQVEAEKIPGGAFSRLLAREVGFGFGVENGRFVVMAVARVEMPVLEFLDLGEFVVDMVGEVGFGQVVDALEVGEAAFAFEALEKMAHADSLAVLPAVCLQEIVAGFRGAEAAFDT